MSSASVRSQPSSPNVAPARLLRAGLLTLVAAVLANVVVRLLLGALTPIDPAFLPLGLGAIVTVTALGVGLGAVVFAFIVRRSSRPVRTWTIVALAALILSILPNFGLMANPASAPMPGGSATYYGLLIVFHLVAGIVAIVLLPRLAGVK